MEVKSPDLQLYKASDVKKALSIYKSELSYWIKTYRLLKPIEVAKGPGTRYKFSLKNVSELAVIKEMINFGLPLNLVKEIKDKLDKKNVFDEALEGSIGKPVRIHICKLKGKPLIYLETYESSADPLEVDWFDIKPLGSDEDYKKTSGNLRIVLELENIIEELKQKLKIN